MTCGFKLRPVARYVEFGRALVDKMLADGSTSYRYFGFLNDTQFADLSKHVMSKVYQSWDGAASSPPKTRSRDDGQSCSPPDLQILGYHNGQPFWPEMLKTRFEEGTPEQEELSKMFSKFCAMFPVQSSESATRPTPGRAGGQCDYTDGGPLEIDRQVELPVVKNEDFTDQRQGNILGAVVPTRM